MRERTYGRLRLIVGVICREQMLLRFASGGRHGDIQRLAGTSNRQDRQSGGSDVQIASSRRGLSPLRLMLSRQGVQWASLEVRSGADRAGRYQGSLRPPRVRPRQERRQDHRPRQPGRERQAGQDHCRAAIRYGALRFAPGTCRDTRRCWLIPAPVQSGATEGRAVVTVRALA